MNDLDVLKIKRIELYNSTKSKIKYLILVLSICLIVGVSITSYIYISTSPKIVYKNKIVKVQDDTLVIINKKLKKDIASLQSALDSRTVVYKNKIIKVPVEKIVYRDRIKEVPKEVEKIVYRDKVVKVQDDTLAIKNKELEAKIKELEDKEPTIVYKDKIVRDDFSIMKIQEANELEIENYWKISDRNVYIQYLKVMSRQQADMMYLDYKKKKEQDLNEVQHKYKDMLEIKDKDLFPFSFN